MKQPDSRRNAALRAAVAAVVMAAGGGLSLSARPSASDRWYLLSIGGQTVGYLREALSPSAGGAAPLRVTSTEMRIVLNRLGSKVEMESRSEFREDASGRIVAFSAATKLSSQEVRSEGTVEGSSIRLKTTAGASSQERTLEFTGDLLGPEGIREATRKRLLKAGDKLEFQTFSPELNQVLHGERTVVGRETIEAGGARVDTLKIEEVLAGIPFKRTAWLDPEGDELRTSEPSPFGDVVGVAADRAACLAAASGGTLPEDSYERTLVRSNVRLPRAREIDSVTMRLRRRERLENPGWPEFPGPGQTVLSKTATELILRVDRPALPRKGQAQSWGPEDIEANPYLDAKDPLIRATAQKVAGAEGGTLERAVRLKTWVSRNMTFDLGIVSPPAAEVIRNRRGTCVGYAMLLTALARAAGIPARFLMGYVYLNGIWGGHAWTEVLADGAWVPLDAAVNGPGIADAARLHVVEADLRNGLSDALLAAQLLFGNLSIDIVEYRLDGKTLVVPAGQKLYETAGDVYRNRGLGLSVEKPADFAFGSMDQTWPDDTLVTMTGPGGRVVGIRQSNLDPSSTPAERAYAVLEKAVGRGVRKDMKIDRRAAFSITGTTNAGAAVANGTDLWVVIARGRDAAVLLDRTLKTFRLDGPVPPVRRD